MSSRYRNPSEVLYTPETDYLFHGTIEPFSGALRPGPDGIVWFAEYPTEAQSYIPTASMTYASKPRWMDDPVRPADQHDAFGAAWRALAGATYRDVSYDAIGRPKGWVYVQQRTWADLWDALSQLGYDTSRSSVKVKMRFTDDGEEILPADYADEGRLFIATVLEPLRLLDSTDIEGSLMDPQYNWFKHFKEVEARGFDGVRINDFLQSDIWGNMSHVAVGLFPRGLKKISYEIIPARNFDPPDRQGWRDGVTPEFLDWLQSR